MSNSSMMVLLPVTFNLSNDVNGQYKFSLVSCFVPVREECFWKDRARGFSFIRMIVAAGVPLLQEMVCAFTKKQAKQIQAIRTRLIPAD